MRDGREAMDETSSDPENPESFFQSGSDFVPRDVCSIVVHLHLNRFPRSLFLPHPKQPGGAARARFCPGASGKEEKKEYSVVIPPPTARGNPGRRACLEVIGGMLFYSSGPANFSNASAKLQFTSKGGS